MGGPAQYFQIVTADNQRGGDYNLPVDSQVRNVAAGDQITYLKDVQVGNSHLRELIMPAQVTVGFQAESAAVQLARPLNGIDHVLSRLRLILFLLCAGGVALAAVLGRLAARQVLAPLAEVAHDRRAHLRDRRPHQPHPRPRR